MATAEQPTQRTLLADDVIPSHYALSIDVDLEACTFSGSVSVTLAVQRPTSTIELYALDLALDATDVTLAPHDGSPLACVSLTSDAAKDGLTVLSFSAPLPLGPALLHIARFSGRLNDNMEGFYRSQYRHSSGQQRYLGVTQFEPTDARRAFPCWDEPALKATFAISLSVDADLLAVSNMPEVARHLDPAGRRATVSFAPTPRMSTYLLAWLVGEFSAVSGRSQQGGTAVTVYTPHGQAEEGQFALDVACRVLDYFEAYYAIPYQLPKLDMAAIPDFAAGAMENWGLVTYRQTALLIAANASVAARQRVAYVVAHELAHQWFGNLVTMQWWRELWLNEGFATYAGQAAIAHLFPQWDMWTAFISDYMAGALRLDALRSSHPIEVEVYSTSQISEIFDAISYYKGASIIRMLANAIGEQAFRDGLRIYLNRHILANAVTTDLWAALSESSGQDVAALMSTWTLKTGYPVVSVAATEVDAQPVLHFSQQRFLADGSVQTDDDALLWPMVLRVTTYTGAQETETKLLHFTTKHASLRLDHPYEWLVVNAGQSTFCRVAYADALAAPLAAALARGDVATADRLGIINDAFALARAGALKTSTALRLVRAFAHEPNYQVASIVAAGLGSLKSVWSSQPQQLPALNRLISATFAPAFQRLTWDKTDGEEDTAALLRALSLGMLVDAHHPASVAQAWQRFALDQPFTAAQRVERLSADLRGPIYVAVAQQGGHEAYQALLDIYKNGTADHGERLKALKALGYTTDPALLKETLRMSLDAEHVRPQDTFLVFSAVGGNPAAPRLAFEFMKENWELISQKVKGALICRIISASTGSLLGEEAVVEIESFFKENPCPAAERTISQVCESIRANTRWLSTDLDDIITFFKDESFELSSSNDIL